MIEPIPAYVRKAVFISNHDGDTVLLGLDHGKYPTSKSVTEVEIRIKDLWCPELSQPGGLEAAEFARSVLSKAQRIISQTYKASFSRTMGDVWVDGRLFAELVIAAGHGTKERL